MKTDNKLEIKFDGQMQHFEILENEILINSKTIKHHLKYSIPLDDVQNEWHIEKGSLDVKTIRLYSSLFLNIFLVLFIIVVVNDSFQMAVKSVGLLLFLPFIYIGIKNNRIYELKHIKSSKVLYFIYTNKNAKEVDDFIRLIFTMQIEFFRKKYFLIDPVLPYNVQYERYIWLYSNKYINENEFEVIKEDLDKYFNFNINNIQQ
jgi:hypothetical protein